MPEPTSEPILDLDTLVIRPVVQIDGVRHEMLSPAELTLRQSHQVAVWARKLEALQQADEEIDAEASEIVAALVQLVMPDLPESIFNKLGDENRLAIAQSFTALLLRRRMAAAEANLAAMQSHPAAGAMSSPGSSGSSAVTRLLGWIKCLWRC